MQFSYYENLGKVVIFLFHFWYGKLAEPDKRSDQKVTEIIFGMRDTMVMLKKQKVSIKITI